MISGTRAVRYYMKLVRNTKTNFRRNNILLHDDIYKKSGVIVGNSFTDTNTIGQSRNYATNSTKRMVQLQQQTVKKEPLKQPLNSSKGSLVNHQVRESHSNDGGSGDKTTFPWQYVVGALGVGAVTWIGYNSQTGKELTKPVQSSSKPKWKPRALQRNPAEASQLPDKIQYLLVGGGTASFAAFRAIKSNDPKAKILIISEEDAYPYMRPPMSKEIWYSDKLPEHDKMTFKQWNGRERNLYYESPAFYMDPTKLASSEKGGVAVALGYTVNKIDPIKHTALVTDGQTEKLIQYDKCMIATGVRPNNIKVFNESSQAVRDRTVLLRTVRDLEQLWHQLEAATSIVIVGGSFLGSELACALGKKFRNTNKKVYQIYKEAGNMNEILPGYLSDFTTQLISNEGVQIMNSTEIKKASMKKNRVNLELSDGSEINADVIIVGAGCTARTELADSSNLEVHPELGGYLVNAELMARSDLYVAGDVACFYDVKLGRRRVEHHDHAVVSGRLAGENMAGGQSHYSHQSMFWSDLGPKLGYEAIGVIDSTLPTVGVFADLSSSKQALKTMEAASGSSRHEEQIQSEATLDESPRIKSSEVLASEYETLGKYGRGVVFYLREHKIVGILMWNLFNRMHLARQLLSGDETYEDLNEVAKLFKMHGE